MSTPLRTLERDWPVAQGSAQLKSDFLHKTYQHLALAVAAFIGLLALLLQAPAARALAVSMSHSWWLVLGVFMVVSMVASRWARSTTSAGVQYLGLGVYVVAEALIFLPLMIFATRVAGPDVLPKAALITGITFAGLTATVLTSKADFSALGGYLRVGFFAALGVIVASLLFGWTLGSWFAGAMAVFAAGSIVYETSNVLHRYRHGQHVAAALALFASVALLFWYVLQLVSASRD